MDEPEPEVGQKFQVTILGDWVEVSWSEDGVDYVSTLTPADLGSVVLIAIFDALREF